MSRRHQQLMSISVGCVVWIIEKNLRLCSRFISASSGVIYFPASSTRYTPRSSKDGIPAGYSEETARWDSNCLWSWQTSVWLTLLELQNQYSTYKNTLQQLAQKIGDVEQEAEEHKYDFPVFFSPMLLWFDLLRSCWSLLHLSHLKTSTHWFHLLGCSPG